MEPSSTEIQEDAGSRIRKTQFILQILLDTSFIIGGLSNFYEIFINSSDKSIRRPLIALSITFAYFIVQLAYKYKYMKIRNL